MITEIKIKRRSRLQTAKGETEFFLEAKHRSDDLNGLGPWTGTYVYADIHRVMNYWIGVSSVNSNPIFVFQTIDEVANYLEEELGLILEYACII